MRLINADMLLSELPSIETEYKYVRKLIENAPTVDAVPVEWIENKIMQELKDMGDNAAVYDYEWLIAQWRIENERTDSRRPHRGADLQSQNH